ncbi:DUF1553 domain-containing protein [Planctomicrobium sp. SH664]|uniref:DUF1553 domain-containing protein n=1 Tax=Planctomicrobium sp. SH664 TaxID=3448125 RepID=UPI003F5B4E3D
MNCFPFFRPGNNKPSLRSCRLLAGSLLCGMFVVSMAWGDDRIRFNQDVRPILSDKCFHCHGPDAGNRKADLRLDEREAALAAHALTPGMPSDSELLRRVQSEDDSERMPPAESPLGRLTPQEIETLRRWIEAGAEYEPHWSFNAPAPTGHFSRVQTTSDLSAAIDATVEETLNKRRLTLQPQASRKTLIRRLTFDLTGLPPTPEEIAAYLADDSLQATEKLVDRLLASPRFGERMAVDWLDLSRYADSYGFQVDRERNVWPWRDWVVSALNRNLPFDQFITWQLAGDLLEQPTDEQILATAFQRMHQQESEGGSIEEEYRVEYVCDRVQTFATAFLGLTFECARCHDHKFDPITQRDYFQLFAMFQNIDEAGLYTFRPIATPTPNLPLTTNSQKARLAELRAEVRQQERQLGALADSRLGEFDSWLASRTAEVPSPFTISAELGRYPFDKLEGGKSENVLAADRPASMDDSTRLVAGRSGQVLEISSDEPVNLMDGVFSRDEPFSISVWLRIPEIKERSVILHRSKAVTDVASRGYELTIEQGRLRWSLIHFWPGNAISIETSDSIPVGEWTHVVLSNDGSSRAEGLRLFLNGKPAKVEVVRDGLTKSITSGEEPKGMQLGARHRDRSFTGGQMDDLRIFGRALTPLEVLATYDEPVVRELLAKDAAQWTPQERQLVYRYYLETFDSAWSQRSQGLLAARKALTTFEDGLTEIMVMEELPEPKPAFILNRGEYSQRGEPVTSNVPEWILPFSGELPRNRLGLAKWITDPRHPLTARVIVNRFWQSLFGRGLVKTAEDFGSQGERPVYPQILDGLAFHFSHHGWDMKALLKAIVLSRTYQQSSDATAAAWEADPENAWLARGPHFRLSAEMIRDNALAVSGLLSDTAGGPPVSPYEMTEAYKPVKVSKGDGVYRRTLYTQWRRTSPPPALVAFGAPTRAVCVARREPTDSPLQAFVLFNGIQYVEAARVLGEKLHRDAKGELPEMLTQGMLRCLGREPDEIEISILTRLYQEQLDHFQSHPNEAKELLAIGSTPRDSTIPEEAAAAATILAQALLTHDGTIMLR